MAKFADITPFYEWIEWLKKERNTNYPDHETLMFYEITDKLDSLPEMVLCKDCKHHVHDGVYAEHCRMHGIMIDADDFCSYGERKDNERKAD